jgi:hypothetical protein
MSYWLGFTFIFAVGIGLLILLLFALRPKRPDPQSKIRKGLQNFTLALLSLFITLMALEFYMKVFFAQTDDFGHTLAFKNWYDRYWGETNSLGYRDREWTWDDVAGKHKIMVLGDSFVAGYGIEAQEDRMSNQLGRLLGDDYAVMTVAISGWGTRSEMCAGAHYPIKPDTLILAYYVNDIEEMVQELGRDEPEFDFVKIPDGCQKPLVENSYLYNFVYWRLYRLGMKPAKCSYWDWVFDLYEDPEAWAVHRRDLLTLAEYTKEEDIQLIVVIIPHLIYVERSVPVVRRISELFQAEGVPTLDVTQLIQGEPRSVILASPVDPHASEMVHRRIAECLCQMIEECCK